MILSVNSVFNRPLEEKVQPPFKPPEGITLVCAAGGGPSRQRQIDCLPRLTIHDCRFPDWTVQNLGIHSCAIVFNHATQSIVGQAHAVNSQRMPIDIPSIGVETVIPRECPGQRKLDRKW